MLTQRTEQSWSSEYQNSFETFKLGKKKKKNDYIISNLVHPPNMNVLPGNRNLIDA